MPEIKVVVLCETADSLGGISKFLTDFRGYCFALGFDIQIISRYHGHRDITDAGKADHYLYPYNFEDWLQELKFLAPDTDEYHELAGKIEASKKLAIAELSRIGGRWDEYTLVLAVQAGSLLQLIDTKWPQDVSRKFTLAFQYHGTVKYARNQAYWTRLRNALKHVDVAIALSDGDAESFEYEGVSGVRVIPNAVSNDSVVPDFQKRQKRLMFMGRLEKEKSVDELLEIWSTMASEFPDWRLDIFGEGSQKANLESLRIKLGIQTSVQFMGVTDNPTHELANSQVHLLCSHNEGMPMSILEANSVGTPTVTYAASPGVLDVVKSDSTGFVVEIGDRGGFAASIRRLLEREDIRTSMSRAALEYSKLFTPSRITGMWKELITETLATKRAQFNSGEIMEEDIVRYSIRLPDHTDRCTLRFVLSGVDIAPKSFVAKIYPETSRKKEELAEMMSLPWSGLLEAPYAYIPDNSSGARQSKIEFKYHPEIGRITLEIVRWGLKRLSPTKTVQACFAEFRSRDDLIENEIVYCTPTTSRN